MSASADHSSDRSGSGKTRNRKAQRKIRKLENGAEENRALLLNRDTEMTCVQGDMRTHHTITIRLVRERMGLSLRSGRRRPVLSALNTDLQFRKKNFSHLLGVLLLAAAFHWCFVRPVYHYEHAAVAADSVECSIIGRDILQQGGNAADAGVASLVCLSLYSAHSMGIGGGNFILYYDRSTKNFTLFDGREVAPIAATENMYDDPLVNSTQGGLAIAVPGELSAMWSLHEKYGNLTWAELFAPSIKLAREGFVVPKALRKALKSRRDFIWADQNLIDLFVKYEDCPDDENGTKVYECLLMTGDIMTRPRFANTLERIANEGRSAFYDGSLTDDIVADIADYGGIITRADLAAYRTAIRKPLEFKLGSSWNAVSVPPPGSGAVLALILNILQGYDDHSIFWTSDAVRTYHRMLEAFRFAYAKRSALGDEDFVDVEEVVNRMLSQQYADDLRQKITDNMSHPAENYGPVHHNVQDRGTTHLSILDAQGNALSATGTINRYFGSKVRGIRTGIFFNNNMDDFAKPNAPDLNGVPPSPANFIVPGKRPMSSMAPVIVTDADGRVRQVLGAAGGTRITTAIAATILHMKWLGYSLGDAIELPRLHDQLIPNEVAHEMGWSWAIVSRLAIMGHNMTEGNHPYAVVQGINFVEDFNLYEAHCDSRKGGQPAGY